MKKKMSLLLKSNSIFNVETKQTFSGAIVIKDNLIEEVYTDDSYNNCQFDRIIDYQDKMIVPGFIDAHQHTFIIALIEAGVIKPINYGSVQAVLNQVASIKTYSNWKIGLGYYASEFESSNFPNAKDIDSVESDFPVMLIAGDVHSIWLNSKALSTLNIKPEDLKKSGGEIIFAPDGTMSGFFNEGIAIHILTSILNSLVTDVSDLFMKYLHVLNSQGVTGIGVLALTGRAENDLISEDIFTSIENKLTVRVSLFPAMREDETILQKLMKQFKNSSRLQIGGTKQFYDGVTSTQTAYMTDEYDAGTGNVGSPMLPNETLHNLIIKSNQMNLPIRVHAIGDRAVRETLNAFIEAESRFPLSDEKRNVIEHLEVFNPNDFDLLNKSNAILSVQPSHALIGYELLWKEVGYERVPWMFPFKDFINHRATLAFGTDAPVVINQTPLQTIFQAVTRRTLENKENIGNGFDQIISIGDAIVSHTFNAAKSNQQMRSGKIERGYFADLAVIDMNLLKANPTEILNAKVEATYFDGKLVYN
jgi:predicted amidohydrolase YtcJ